MSWSFLVVRVGYCRKRRQQEQDAVGVRNRNSWGRTHVLGLRQSRRRKQQETNTVGTGHSRSRIQQEQDTVGARHSQSRTHQEQDIVRIGLSRHSKSRTQQEQYKLPDTVRVGHSRSRAHWEQDTVGAGAGRSSSIVWMSREMVLVMGEDLRLELQGDAARCRTIYLAFETFHVPFLPPF